MRTMRLSRKFMEMNKLIVDFNGPVVKYAFTAEARRTQRSRRERAREEMRRRGRRSREFRSSSVSLPLSARPLRSPRLCGEESFDHLRRFLLLAAILLAVALPRAISAQTLLEKKFNASAESEALLDLTASAPGTSWRERGAEAAVATIYVDGQYHQDVILFAGAREFTYQLMLGRVGPGEHNLRIEFNRKQSAE